MKKDQVDPAVEPSIPIVKNIVYIKKFRFLLYGNNLDPSFIISADFNWISKTIKITAYEVYDTNKNEDKVVKWAEAIENKKYPKETLTLVTFDYDNGELYSYKFSGITITSRTNSFDTKSPDESIHVIDLQYKQVEKLMTKK